MTLAKIIALPYGWMGSNTWLIVCPEQTILIDPSAPVKRLPEGLPPVGLILATHGHLDHINRADAWREATSASLAIHTDDADCLTDARKNLSAQISQPFVCRPAEQLLDDGQSLRIDADRRLEVLHTPGHTPGCCCFLFWEFDRAVGLFSGDVLFADSIGRTDLDGGDPSVMALSLRRLRQIGHDLGVTRQHDLPVYPGHGRKTGLAAEMAGNPYF
jgi:glyoxylase-like metal-dependent hydrolase (beta-lactamase superfamily II)